MRADYDSEANAISIEVVPGAQASRAEQVDPRLIVALGGDSLLELQLLYPDRGVDEPLRLAAQRYGVDAESLVAAAAAALAAPDRAVTVEVAVRSAA